VKESLLSINAYPVIDLELGKVSFNLYSDRDLSDYLDAEVALYGKIHDGSGLVNIPVKVLNKAMRRSVKLKLESKTIERLRSDIQYAKFGKDEVVTYYCF
jgi:hypothetical protein